MSHIWLKKESLCGREDINNEENGKRRKHESGMSISTDGAIAQCSARGSPVPLVYEFNRSNIVFQGPNLSLKTVGRARDGTLITIFKVVILIC